MLSRHPATHDGISDTRPGKVVGFGAEAVVAARAAAAKMRMRKKIVFIIGTPIVSCSLESWLEG